VVEFARRVQECFRNRDWIGSLDGADWSRSFIDKVLTRIAKGDTDTEVGLLRWGRIKSEGGRVVLPEEARDYDNSIKDLRPFCKGRPSTLPSSKRDLGVVCLFRSQCDSLPTLLSFERLHPTTRTTRTTLDDDVGCRQRGDANAYSMLRPCLEFLAWHGNPDETGLPEERCLALDRFIRGQLVSRQVYIRVHRRRARSTAQIRG